MKFWIFVLRMFVLLAHISCLIWLTISQDFQFRFRGFAESFVSLFHSAQYKKVNVSISGLNIFPNEYSGWYENSKGHAFCSSRIDVHFAETRTPYSPNEGILFTCHDWGLLSAYGICQLFLAYQRKTSLLNQVFMPPHQIIWLWKSGNCDVRSK